MESVKKIERDYLKLLEERVKKSRVRTAYQSTGLLLAEFLNDPVHKSLYMRLAKQYDHDLLIRLAKNLQERKDIKNKGAYFMKVLKSRNQE